jgi:hypothetical protein
MSEKDKQASSPFICNIDFSSVIPGDMPFFVLQIRVSDLFKYASIVQYHH